MVLPIGFFMPLPLAMMIPFMGIQSAVMAKQFGENFQYGKRRISAMSNDEFNKLTPQKINERAAEELKSMIPSMKQSIIDMQDFQTFLIKEFIKMIGDILTSGLGKVLGITGGEVDQVLQDIEHFIHGHPDLHKGSTPKPTPTPTTQTEVITDKGELAPPPTEFPKTGKILVIWTNTVNDSKEVSHRDVSESNARGLLHSEIQWILTIMKKISENNARVPTNKFQTDFKVAEGKRLNIALNRAKKDKFTIQVYINSL